MSDIIEEKDKILYFTLFKVEKGREKICKCNPPHYEIDTVNRIVTCKDCGATLDPFDALLTLVDYMGRYSEYQKMALKKVKVYAELADEEWKRRIKNQIFKDMDANYRKDLYPVCPECGKIFDPIKITNWTNKAFYEGEDKNERTT